MSGRVTTRRRIGARPRDNTEGLIHTDISYYALLISIIGMLFIGFRHFDDIDELGQLWGRFALLLAGLGIVAFIGIEIVQSMRTGEPGFKFPPQNRPAVFQDFADTVLLFVFIIVVQIIIVIIRLAITDVEKGLYYIFAAVIEECFFRGFIISLFLFEDFEEPNPIRSWSAVLFSSVFFAILHTHFYDQLDKLLGVFLAGIVFGWFFIVRRSLTANIGGHFLNNSVTAFQTLGQVLLCIGAIGIIDQRIGQIMLILGLLAFLIDCYYYKYKK